MEDKLLYVQIISDFIIYDSKKKTITIGNKPKKLWLLFKYLLVHNSKPIHYEVIYESLQFGASKNEKNMIKNLIYRLRKLLVELKIYGPDYIDIIYKNDCYVLNIGNRVVYDVNHLESLKNVKDPVYASQELLNLCGAILPEEAYAEWLLPIRVRYENLYLQILRKIVEALYQDSLHKNIIKLLENIQEIWQDDEVIASYFLKSYIDLGYRSEAIQFYYKLEERLYLDFGIDPSDELKTIIKNINETSLNIRSETIPMDGAFICNYNEFVKIYQLEKRKRLRQKDDLLCFKVVIGDHTSPKDEVLQNIKSTIIGSLRQCDVLSESSKGVFHIMLNNTIADAVQVIENRIIQKINNHNHGIIDYEVEWIN